MDDFKKGDIVKGLGGRRRGGRGIIIGKSMEGLSDDWLQIFSFSEGGEVVHHISYLIKVEDEGG